jgi:Glycosyl transferase family 2
VTTRHGTHGRVQAVGVAIPAHNEKQYLARALRSVEDACAEIDCWNMQVRVAIVLDTCWDESEDIACEWTESVRQRYDLSVETLACEYQNVGRARAVGCDSLLRFFRKTPSSRIWLATSDADSLVPRDWLAAQLSQRVGGADAWVGRVSVRDWTSHASETSIEWERQYESECRPIHGANLGFAADWYLAAGGFPAMSTGEDRAMVEALLGIGATVHFDSATRVTTSSRRHARAPGGFAAALQNIEACATRRSSSWQAAIAIDERATG